jgi:hypothetical protein
MTPFRKTPNWIACYDCGNNFDPAKTNTSLYCADCRPYLTVTAPAPRLNPFSVKPHSEKLYHFAVHIRECWRKTFESREFTPTDASVRLTHWFRNAPWDRDYLSALNTTLKPRLTLLIMDQDRLDEILARPHQAAYRPISKPPKHYLVLVRPLEPAQEEEPRTVLKGEQ